VNPRERKLAIAIGGLIGIFVVGFGVRGFFLKPLRELDGKIAGVREKLAKIHADRRDYFTAEDAMKRIAARCFSDDLDLASARSGEMLTRIIINSGLREADFSRVPVGPRKMRGAQEIGWGVRGEGGLAQVVNLIFLLEKSTPVHRLDGLVLSAGDTPGRVRVNFRYLTFVLEPAPESQPLDLELKFTAESPERRTYAALVTRDILRPYVKRAPPKPEPGSPPPPPPAPPGTEPGPETFRVVSLSEWMGKPEVHVRDLSNQKTLRFQPGDPLAGGRIVLVDYRALPMPGNESLLSNSRVIVKIGNEFWAVERGQTLANRYKLKPDQLPESLTKL